MLYPTSLYLFIQVDQSVYRKFMRMFLTLEAQTRHGIPKCPLGRAAFQQTDHSDQQCHTCQFSIISSSNGKHTGSSPSYVCLVIPSSQYPISLCDYICDSQVSGNAQIIDFGYYYHFTMERAMFQTLFTFQFFMPLSCVKVTL